jgi:hypothetical protein
MRLFEPVQRQPGQLLRVGEIEFGLECLGDLGWAGLAVTLLPDPRRRRVQCMDLLALPIVDAQFMAKLFDVDGRSLFGVGWP